MSEDVSPERTLRTDATVQGVVDSLSGGHMADRPVDEVAGALQQGLQDAGLPEQPAPWVEATAREIAADRIVVSDTRAQVDPQDLRKDDEGDRGTDSAPGSSTGSSTGSSSGSTAAGR